MFGEKIALLSCILQLTSCDWASEWLSPVQDQFKARSNRRNNYDDLLFEEDKLRMVQVTEAAEEWQEEALGRFAISPNELSTAKLKTKLENTLSNARKLASTLAAQIKEVTERENLLKDAIVNGRSGLSTVLVSTLDRPPRSYIIREGSWSLCKGALRAQSPFVVASASKCNGEELPSQQDPCVFNSMIKYETLPMERQLEYREDDYLCLKRTFNSTLERYLSVPRQIIEDTCQNGTIRSLEENVDKCGLRVMTEYTYYPSTNSALGLPLEYCAEPDGACKLIMAWHVSNSSVENFEFLKNEPGFKKYFIKSRSYAEHMI